ncbi:hypothetical protein [Aeoliella mucimassa]|uniref:Uncharacterized protein n=1 Tax=Aeoliella mucimassa TaxID=2527972 RepID=A0A518ANI3_9BACT|nr:hypothetical protein [Aeoliella mucimassa]QDU56280.1 hypothetical protein Pan181_24890 [Aeoliella mucimassa]
MAGTRTLLAILIASGLMLTGCLGTESTTTIEEHDHDHKHVEVHSLGEAVTVLQEMRDELAEAYKNSDIKTVDGLFHDEVSPISKQLNELVTESGLQGDDLEAAKAAVEQLLSVFDVLHPSHAADATIDPATYDAQADSFNDALVNLEMLAAKAPATEETPAAEEEGEAAAE